MAYFGSFKYPEFLATETNYTAFTGGDAPANVTQLLRSASLLVLEATSAAYYATDPNTGDAIDTQIADALTRATVIQAAAWSAMGYDPLTGGVVGTTVVQSTKAGGTSDTFADAQYAAQARADAVRNLVPDAVRVLEYNNLLRPAPWVFG